ncbi:unnamed protein product (macronuclear) [Paramecium tetraurelia]|uniref:EF-hand domain-containing protein n=1 Tax=Paramecium tetraurelia TaxID=5888 RepID=A0DNW5_PARTE|nr:uncharacterized protein GSPATT00018928001 [Paramecium tetraurelia]CAK84732.1 unnamed protein product [Paramecium tetraurelia]|eukprot:XP_001452129.1 hypothetical protein (macronuclear) [Paramecium tetraurelia strain d4-2]
MSQLTPQTLSRLCEYFLYLAKLESEIEIIRNVLCEHVRFHPFFIFKYIDGISINPKGQLSPADLLQFLDDNGFVHNLEECIQFIDLYDEDSKGFLLYSQFLRICLPQNNVALRQKIALQNVDVPHYDQKISYTLSKLINYEIKSMETTSTFVQQLQNCSDYSPTACFEFMNPSNSQGLIASHFKDLFQKSAIIIYPHELQSLFKRFDLLNDGIIDISEFIKHFKSRVLNPKDYKTPIKDKSYLQHFKDKSQQKQAQSQQSNRSKKAQTTPIKKLNSILKQTGQSPKKEFDNQRSVSFVETSKSSKTQNLNSSYIFKTPNQQHNQKYINQKTELRAQMQLFKVQKQQQGLNNSTIKKPTQNSTQKKVIKNSPKKNNQFFNPSKFLKDTLISLLNFEKEIERIKLNLQAHPDFSLCNTFRALDKKKMGFLVTEDLEQFINKQSLSIILKKASPDGRIKFNQFIQLVSPLSIYHQEQQLIREQSQHQSNIIQGRIKQLLSLLFEKLYQRELLFDQVNQEIKQNQQCDIKYLFMMIDEDSCDNEISLKDLDSFLYKQQVQPELEDLELLFNRLDTDRDGKISFPDFINIFSF